MHVSETDFTATILNLCGLPIGKFFSLTPKTARKFDLKFYGFTAA